MIIVCYRQTPIKLIIKQQPALYAVDIPSFSKSIQHERKHLLSIIPA